ncbi:MAG: tetratricopeptide repeat protein [Candidatus Riflebacteria bacterium]|nr:tetratricopeptide repeat protein [Candidatus Riflebacteria bacterium]
MTFPGLFEAFIPNLGRILSIAIVFSVWIFSFDHQNTFHYQQFFTILLASFSLTCFSLIFSFRNPLKPFFTIRFFVVLFIISISLCFRKCFSLEGISSGFLILSQIALFMALRLSLKKESSGTILNSIILSGTMMSIYGILQALNLDMLTWPGSPFKTVGTFGNPNLLAVYIACTIIVTFVSIQHPIYLIKADYLLYPAISIQIISLLLCYSSGAVLTLTMGFFFFKKNFWERELFPHSKYKTWWFPLVLIACIFSFYYSISYCTSKYPWFSLSKTPASYLSLVSRLVEWKMGIDWISDSPLTGSGIDSAKYLFHTYRPPFGTILRLSMYNDDPHAFFLKFLAECGLIPLYAAFGIFCVAFALHKKRRNHPASDKIYPFHKMTLTLLIMILFNGSFSNSFSVTPIVNFFILISALHFCFVLRDVKWTIRKPSFRMVFILPACLFSILGTLLSLEAGAVSKNLFSGQQNLENNQAETASKCFSEALKYDPMNPGALWGIARAYEKLGNSEKALKYLYILNNFSNNIFGCQHTISELLLKNGLIIEAHKWAVEFYRKNNSTVAYELLGDVFLAEGRFEEAEKSFLSGVSVIADWFPEERQSASRIRLRLASIAIDSNNPQNAKDHLFWTEEPEKNSAEYFFLQGYASYKMSLATEALEFFEQSYKSSPENPRYANSLAYTLLETGKDFDRAGKILKDCYQKISNDKKIRLDDLISIVHSLATYYHKKNDLKQARELMLIAIRDCPEEWSERKTKMGKELQKIINEMKKR